MTIEEGGRRTVGAVRLPIIHRLGGTGDQRHLARQVGRPDCGFRDSAAHCSGGSGSHAREGLRLLLACDSLQFRRFGNLHKQRRGGQFDSSRLFQPCMGITALCLSFHTLQADGIVHTGARVSWFCQDRVTLRRLSKR